MASDFLVSNLFLPLGSLVYLLFCVSRCGWGWNGFYNEANQGVGLKLHPALRFYLRWILPPVIVILLVIGYIDKFSH